MKKAWGIIIIALSGIAVIGGYAVLNSIFPKSDPIKFPDTESITAIIRRQNNHQVDGDT